MYGLSSSIRVGLPSPGDPHGDQGPGFWWITGGCRPAYLWDSSDRPRRGWRRLVRGRRRLGRR
jgi:hypothetical protein